MSVLRRSFVFAAVGAIALQAAGQPPPITAVPYYTPAAFIQGVHRYWFLPQAQAFAAESAALVGALDTLCAASGGEAPAQLQDARARWLRASQAWDRLSSVSVGPLLTRRSARQIDFSPARPEMIERALRMPPGDLQGLERIGAPAKGFPALEWLLWHSPVRNGEPGCALAPLLARHIDAEAQALVAAFAELAARDWASNEAAAVAAMAELVNQWVGGIERLRWAQIEKPLRSARGADKPAYLRARSGGTRDSWQAQWQALRALAVESGAAAPLPGQGLVSLETYLRGRGLNPLADRLEAAGVRAGRQVDAADPGRGASAQSAARALSGFKQLAEAQVAPALNVQIGFSDSDGD